ncbi:hypothetical protein AAMO2058_001059400 [Amorphochlora amoebiformis]
MTDAANPATTEVPKPAPVTMAEGGTEQKREETATENRKRPREEDGTGQNAKESKQKTESVEAKGAAEASKTEAEKKVDAPKIVMSLGADEGGADVETLEATDKGRNRVTVKIVEAKVTPIQTLPDGSTMQLLDCPATLVGRVIGRSGQTIRWLENKTKCKIQIDQNFPPGHPRKIQITGSRGDMENAVKIVSDTMHNGPPDESMQTPTATAGAVAGPKVKIAAGSGPEVSETIDCPQNLVGRVIGRGGETIRDLQDRSGCNIQIDQNFPQGVPRKISVTGKQSLVQAAVTMIKDVMENGPPNRTGGGISVGGTTEQIINCDALLVGRIIGRKGETISEIQARSGARVQIDQSMPAGQPRKIHITGNPQAIQIASELVRRIMANPATALSTLGGTSGTPNRQQGYGNYQAGGGYNNTGGYGNGNYGNYGGYNRQQAGYGGYQQQQVTSVFTTNPELPNPTLTPRQP